MLAVNLAVTADAGLIERDPYGTGWLIEAQLGDAAGGLPGLLADAAEITAWFTAKVADYRRMGVIAQ